MLKIWETQRKWLDARGRLHWAMSEFDRMIADIQADERTPVWNGFRAFIVCPDGSSPLPSDWPSGVKKKPPIATDLLAEILRDDLLIDLAKRRPKTVQQALATRDLNRPEYRKRIEDMLVVIEEVNRMPEDQLPKRIRSQRDETSADEQVISKLLALALANRCAELEVAQSLVGTSRDLTELVRAVRNGDPEADTRMLSGWRGEVCGELLKKVLDGK